MNAALVLRFLALVAVAAGSAQAQDSVAPRFVGTWRLVSTEQKLADGSIRPSVFGPRGVGYLIYTDVGRMCAILMNPDRPRWQADSLASDREVRAAYDRFIAYCGTYEVNAADGSVVHHIELDKSPNAVGLDRKRFFKLSDDRLVLTVAPPLPAGVAEYRLTWERVGR